MPHQVAVNMKAGGMGPPHMSLRTSFQVENGKGGLDGACSVMGSLCVCHRESFPAQSFMGYQNCYMQMKLFDMDFPSINDVCL